MGTDIHMIAQARTSPKGMWHDIRVPTVNQWWAETYQEYLDEGSLARAEQVADYRINWEVYSSRNYTLFAVLGDVRNGFGVAGMDMGDRITPSVGALRGLPDDFELKEDEHYGTWMGDHSYGWLTMAEAFEYPWHTEIVKRGVISVKEWANDDWREGGPSSWSGGILGPNIVEYRDEEDLLLAKANGTYDENKENYVRVQWVTILEHRVEDFLDAMRYLRQIIPDIITDDNIRIVYGFDS